MDLICKKLIYLERKVQDGKEVESKVQIGKCIFNIKSSFTGDKTLSEILFKCAQRELSA